MSNEIQRHERYKQYAYNAYHLGNANIPEKFRGKKFQDLSPNELNEAIKYFI